MTATKSICTFESHSRPLWWTLLFLLTISRLIISLQTLKFRKLQACAQISFYTWHIEWGVFYIRWTLLCWPNQRDLSLNLRSVFLHSLEFCVDQTNGTLSLNLWSVFLHSLEICVEQTIGNLVFANKIQLAAVWVVNQAKSIRIRSCRSASTLPSPRLYW